VTGIFYKCVQHNDSSHTSDKLDNNFKLNNENIDVLSVDRCVQSRIEFFICIYQSQSPVINTFSESIIFLLA